MSFPRFRLVQGKAIGERSTPTAPTPNLISTPEPPPQHVIKQEDVHMESNYPLDTHQIKNEPQTSSISMDDALSPPPHLLGNQQPAPPATSQPQHAMQRPMQPMQFQTPPPQQMDTGLPGCTTDDKNVTKCVRFLKTLINLSNNEDPEQPDKAIRVKSLIQGVVYMETSAEEFTRNLQQVLKSQAQPHLLPFLQNTIPALRQAVRNGEACVDGVDPPPGYVFSNGRAPPQPGHPSQIISRLNADHPQLAQRPPMMRPPPPQAPPQQHPMHPQQPRPMGGLPMHPPPQHHLAPPQNQNIPPPQPQPQQQPQQHQQQQQQQPNPDPRMDMSGGVEASRKRPYAEGSLTSAILKPDEVLQRITKRMMSSCSVEEEALVAISDAVESHLRELITQMAGIAEHRVESMRVPENYVAVDDVKRQLRFLEDLDRQDEELRESREKESLIRMSKNKNSGKETIEKAKEMQRQDAEAKRNRDANAAAIAALSTNRAVKNKWEGSAPASAPPRPRTVRVTTRDLHMLVNTDKRFRGTFIREKLSYGGPATDTSI